jgi:hypothetical protein
MRPFVYLFQLFYRVVCVNLGSSKTAVAKQLLDSVDVSAVVGKVSGKTVP